MAAKKRTTPKPPRSAIADFVLEHPLFSAHTHLMPIPEWAKLNPHFSALASYAAADLVIAAGPLAISETHLPPLADPAYAKRYFELWRAARFTGYTTAVELASRELLGVEYTEQNAEAVNNAIARLIGKDPAASYRAILRDKANIRWLIKDSLNRPEDAADHLFPRELIRCAYRDDELLCIRNRLDVAQREERWNRSVHSVSDLVAGLNESISACLATGKYICFKIGVAYQRSLAFTEPTLHEAERAFARLMNLSPADTLDSSGRETGVRKMSRVSAQELRPLQDYLTHQFVRRAEAENLPVQVHTGYLAGTSNVLNNIRAMDMLPFLLRYPRVRFDLFHAGWPYTEEHAVIGKELPNVWLDLCWAWAMNPVTTERALESWLACVPHTKIFAYGGDTGNPMNEYGFAQQARTGIARVLQRCIDRGQMTLPEAQDAAAHIMLLNPCRFHRLDPGDR